jgi:repressor LexA
MVMPGFEQLTEKQLAVYQFIRDAIRRRGYGPTVRDIGDAFGIKSPNGVMCHLRALEAKGFIHREENKARAIELIQEPLDEDRGLPLAGRIAAGGLHEAIEQKERIDLGEFFRGKGLFALEVSGDSMIEAQIADGDFVVVKKQKSAQPGQIVVAITDDGETTLKYWYPEKKRVRLQPANSTMDPIYCTNAQVEGVVVGVVRKVR